MVTGCWLGFILMVKMSGGGKENRSCLSQNPGKHTAGIFQYFTCSNTVTDAHGYQTGLFPLSDLFGPVMSRRLADARGGG